MVRSSACAPAESLWRLLRRMGIRSNSTQHPAFGNIAETFQQMAKEKYVMWMPSLCCSCEKTSIR